MLNREEVLDKILEKAKSYHLRYIGESEFKLEVDMILDKADFVTLPKAPTKPNPKTHYCPSCCRKYSIGDPVRVIEGHAYCDDCFPSGPATKLRLLKEGMIVND